VITAVAVGVTTGYKGFIRVLESPGILFWHLQDWKVLEN